MRQIYTLTLTPVGLFGFSMDSDTLFGHICWAVRYVYGEDTLTGMLEKFKKKPLFLISSAFPEKFLPKPVLPSIEIPYDQNREKKQLSDSMKENKKIKKKSYCSIDFYKKNQKNITHTVIRGDLLTQSSIGHDSKNGVTTITRNAINRETFTVEEHALFSETYNYDNRTFTAYIEIINPEYDEKWFEPLIQYLSETGLGRDISVGKGRFKIELKQAESSLQSLFSESGNYFVSLSHCAGGDMEPVSYQLYPKYGKVGGEFSQSGVFAKNPVVFYKTGAVFKSSSDALYQGCMINGVHNDERILQYGYAFPLYFNSNEVVL